jgi:tRNA nucleotidyltransferase (CCA-adding enzyme)
VGGLVRDAFLAIEGTDLDIATNLSPQEVIARCNACGLRVVETGIEHGTVLIVIDEVHIEVTTFRTPSERSSHITALSIETDLSGRDFTINALAFDIKNSKLIDPFQGVLDLQKGVLRAVADPFARFQEDPLRILRLLRFGPASGRIIETATCNAAKSLVHELSRISVERIKSELDKILLSPLPAEGIRSLKELGGLPFTLPELIPSIGFEQNEFHVEDVFEHTMTVLSRTPADKVLRWAALFHDTGKPHTLSVDEDGRRHFYLHEVVSEELALVRMKHLRFSLEESRAIALIVKQHMRPMDCGAPGVRRIMRDLGESYDQWRRFKLADISPTMPEEEFTKVATRFDELKEAEAARLAGPSYGKLAVDGNDLIQLGIKPGPAMGSLLKELEELVLDDPAQNDHENLLRFVRKKVGVSGT